MSTVYLGIGTNLGDRELNLLKAIELVKEHIGNIERISSVYETEPWGFESENCFLNMVARVATKLSPSGLLGRILMIEALMGRIREGKDYQSRVIDIDILFYDNRIIEKKVLIIPHPALNERKFLLMPLSEIAADLIHPVLGKNIRELLDECKDQGKVVKFRKIN